MKFLIILLFVSFCFLASTQTSIHAGAGVESYKYNSATNISYPPSSGQPTSDYLVNHNLGFVIEGGIQFAIPRERNLQFRTGLNLYVFNQKYNTNSYSTDGNHGWYSGFRQKYTHLDGGIPLLLQFKLKPLFLYAGGSLGYNILTKSVVPNNWGGSDEELRWFTSNGMVKTDFIVWIETGVGFNLSEHFNIGLNLRYNLVNKNPFATIIFSYVFDKKVEN